MSWPVRWLDNPNSPLNHRMENHLLHIGEGGREGGEVGGGVFKRLAGALLNEACLTTWVQSLDVKKRSSDVRGRYAANRSAGLKQTEGGGSKARARCGRSI